MIHYPPVNGYHRPVTRDDFEFLCGMLKINPNIALENINVVDGLRHKNGWDALEQILENEF